MSMFLSFFLGIFGWCFCIAGGFLFFSNSGNAASGIPPLMIGCILFVIRFFVKKGVHETEKEENRDYNPQSNTQRGTNPPTSTAWSYAKPISVVSPDIMLPEVFISQCADNYIAFDLETTGLSQSDDDIIEIGAVKIKQGVIADTFSTFVNPERHIPESATRINHITDEMVASAPVQLAAVSDFIAFTEGLPCVAHNVSFDAGFLLSICQDLDLTPPDRYGDTMKMARKYIPGIENYKLYTVCASLGYEISDSHRALSDAKAVHFIVQACKRRKDAIAKTEKDWLAHIKLCEKIETEYRLVTSCAEDESYQKMLHVVDLCNQDWKLIENAKIFAKVKGYPAPRFDSFRRAAIIYAKLKNFDMAISVCRKAIACGYSDDGNPGGMEARIAKLLQQKERAESKRAEQKAKDAKKERKKNILPEQPEEPSLSGNAKQILQFSCDGSTLLKVYKSISEASQDAKTNPKSIRDAATGKQKHAGGYTWRFVEDFNRQHTGDTSTQQVINQSEEGSA